MTKYASETEFKTQIDSFVGPGKTTANSITRAEHWTTLNRLAETIPYTGVAAIGNVTGATAINLNSVPGSVKKATLTGAVTITFLATIPGSYQLIVTQDATGGRTMAYANLANSVEPAQPNLGANEMSMFEIVFDGTLFYLK